MCHPENKKTAQAGNYKPGAGGRTKKRELGWFISNAVKAPEATLDLGKGPWLSTRLRSGCHFANLYYYFAACHQTQRKFAQTALKWKTWLKQTHRAEFDKFDKYTAGLTTQSKPEHNDTHATSKPGTLTYCVLLFNLWLRSLNVF